MVANLFDKILYKIMNGIWHGDFILTIIHMWHDNMIKNTFYYFLRIII
jgi:hypothetical protein